MGCTHSIKLINPQTGETLRGEYNEVDRSVKVWLNSGEILSGTYSTNQAGYLQFNQARATAGLNSAFSSGTTAVISNSGTAVSVVTGGGKVMFIRVQFSGSSGFGKAEMNDGTEYIVQF